jgi:hypothetical protein
MNGNRSLWLRQIFRPKTTRNGLFNPQVTLPTRESHLPPVGFFAHLKIRIYTQRDVIYQSEVRQQSLSLALDNGNVRMVIFCHILSIHSFFGGIKAILKAKKVNHFQ